MIPYRIRCALCGTVYRTLGWRVRCHLCAVIVPDPVRVLREGIA